MLISFGLLAVGAAVAAWMQDVAYLRWLMVWTAGAFGWVALAYAGLGPRLGKDRRGRLSLLSRIALAPYHGLNALSLRLCRDPLWTEIVPGLYLGRRLSPAQAADLGPMAAVLDFTAELAECSAFGDVDYRVWPTLDKRPVGSKDLRAAVAFLQACPRPVYLHCALGHGRSASVVAAYLLVTGQVAGAEEAECYLRERRPKVALSREQLASLREFER